MVTLSTGLENFLAELGLGSLLDTFAAEMVDMDTMLAWEDPKRELFDLGITQKGILFRISKGLDIYKTNGMLVKLTSFWF